MKAARPLPCPTCGKPALFAPENPWRPFCCERCRSIDLGAWASEAYRIPRAEPEATAGEAESREHDPETDA